MSELNSPKTHFEAAQGSPYHQKRAGLERPVGQRRPRIVTLTFLGLLLVMVIVALSKRL